MSGSGVKDRRGLEWFKFSIGCGRGSFLKNRGYLALSHAGKSFGCFECLIEYLHTVDSGDDDRGRKAQRKMQALDGSDRLALKNVATGHWLHAKDSDFLFHQNRYHLFFKAAKMGVHDV